MKLRSKLIIGLFSWPSMALGYSEVSAINHALTGLLDLLTGKSARSIAILAIIGIGYMTLSGRLAMKHALYTCLGIGIIFGASSIADLLGVGVR